MKVVRSRSYKNLPAARFRNEAFREALRRGGRPPKAKPKQPISLRLSPEVLAEFRASGRGWQTRIDDALKDWLRSHRP